jgi:hypothetical protein
MCVEVMLEIGEREIERERENEGCLAKCKQIDA